MSWIVAILIVIVLTAILIFIVVIQNIKDLKGETQNTWELRTSLASRRETNFVINLYSVDKFFAEGYYNPEDVRSNTIRSFKSRHYLDAYLDEIEING